MRRFLLTLGLFAMIASVLLGPAVVFAQAPSITIVTNAPLPLLVDGLETEKLPAAIGLGREVCVVSAQHYTAEAERWLFQRWSHGPTTECVTLTQPGVYKALYRHEVVLHIRSSINQLQKSDWVAYGTPVDFQVPASVAEGERTRYRFLEWSDGETPTMPANRIAPLKPTILEAKWTREHLVRTEGPEGVTVPGSGWYAEGASLVLQAPDVIAGQGATDRLKFARWETVGAPSLLIPDAAKPALTAKVDAPYTLKAVYDKQYKFVAVSPFGTLKNEWQKDGTPVLLSTPPVQEVIPEQERFVFKRWEGLPGVLVPSLSGIVDQPIELKAVYERQVMVTLDAPYGGSGGGWQTPGTTVTVSVPGSEQSKLVFNRRFLGFAGYAPGKSSIQVLVTEPITITALYRTEVDSRVLGLLLAPLWLALFYVVSRWVLRLAPRRRGVD